MVELEKEIPIEYVWVSSKLVIEDQPGVEFNGVEIQLYLVDENDVRITEYPMLALGRTRWFDLWRGSSRYRSCSSLMG